MYKLLKYFQKSKYTEDPEGVFLVPSNSEESPSKVNNLNSVRNITVTIDQLLMKYLREVDTSSLTSLTKLIASNYIFTNCCNNDMTYAILAVYQKDIGTKEMKRELMTIYKKYSKDLPNFFLKKLFGTKQKGYFYDIEKVIGSNKYVDLLKHLLKEMLNTEKVTICNMNTLCREIHSLSNKKLFDLKVPLDKIFSYFHSLCDMIVKKINEHLQEDINKTKKEDLEYTLKYLSSMYSCLDAVYELMNFKRLSVRKSPQCQIMPRELLNLCISYDNKADICLSDYITSQVHEERIRHSSIYQKDTSEFLEKLRLSSKLAKVVVLRKSNESTLEIGIVYTERRDSEIEIRHSLYIDTGRLINKACETFTKIFLDHKAASGVLKLKNDKMDKDSQKKLYKNFKKRFNEIEKKFEQLFEDVQVNIFGDFMFLLAGDYKGSIRIQVIQ